MRVKFIVTHILTNKMRVEYDVKKKQEHTAA